MKEITVELRKWIILVCVCVCVCVCARVCVRACVRIYIYITALQGTRWNENGWIDKEECTLFYGAEREQRQGNGTAFVVLKMLGRVQ